MARARIALVHGPLDRDLATPYFAAHPDDAQALRAHLTAGGDAALSLQQLLLDLDRAEPDGLPNFCGAAAADPALPAIGRAVITAYLAQVQAAGAPVLAVFSRAGQAAPSGATLQIRDTALAVAAPVDALGAPIAAPTPEQQRAATLDYRCSLGGATVAPVQRLPWNWVEPDEVRGVSGVIALSRRALAEQLHAQLVPAVRHCCIVPNNGIRCGFWGGIDFSWGFGNAPAGPDADYPDPDAPATPRTLLVLHHAVVSDQGCARFWTHGHFDVHTRYECRVTFDADQLTVTQRLVVWVRVRRAATEASGNVVDASLSVPYTLSVAQDGSLVCSAGEAQATSQAQSVRLGGFVNFWVDLNPTLDRVAETARLLVPAALRPVPLDLLARVVFPAGRVFAFKDVRFSDHGDLVAGITYGQPPAA